VSALKVGLLFSDGIGLVDGRSVNGAMHNKARSLYEGIFEMQMHKLRHWASGHSLRAYLDAYQELLRLPKTKPLLESLLKRLHTDEDAVRAFIDSWGPLPRERYGYNQIGFLIQAPRKAYSFWEWNGSGIERFDVLIDHHGVGRRIVSEGVSTAGEYWFDVEPDQEYSVELIGWTPSGHMKTLMRSRPVKTPRDCPSPNRNATLIDVKTKQKLEVEGGVLPGSYDLRKLGASEFLGASGRFGSSNVVNWGSQ
jgi:hypothetical protein